LRAIPHVLEKKRSNYLFLREKELLLVDTTLMRRMGVRDP